MDAIKEYLLYDIKNLEPHVISAFHFESVQVGANLALFISANVIGCHHRMLTDHAHKRTFSHVRSYIESRIRLEHQSQQQVSIYLYF